MKPLQLDDFLITGRTFEKYVVFFDYKNSRVDELDNLSPFAYQIAEKFGGEICKVGFEFQKNAGYMLRIKRYNKMCVNELDFLRE
jgi:hypothetical protein